jgi:hypothetical protein
VNVELELLYLINRKSDNLKIYIIKGATLEERSKKLSDLKKENYFNPFYYASEIEDEDGILYICSNEKNFINSPKNLIDSLIHLKDSLDIVIDEVRAVEPAKQQTLGSKL